VPAPIATKIMISGGGFMRLQRTVLSER
jgi:hypothetical protein